MRYKLSNTKINSIGPPCRKKVYYSAEEANDMIRYIKENRHLKEISSYKCTVCGFWHLTSKAR
jgi:hypothetical protein